MHERTGFPNSPTPVSGRCRDPYSTRTYLSPNWIQPSYDVYCTQQTSDLISRFFSSILTDSEKSRREQKNTDSKMVGDASTSWTAPSSRGTSWTGVRTDTSMKSFQQDESSDMQQVYGKCSCTERFAEDVTLSRTHFASHLRNEMRWDDLTGEMTGAVTGKMGAVYVMVLTIYRFSRFCAAIMTFLWKFWEKNSSFTQDF